MEKRHGEITCKVNLLSVEAHIDREGFDQVFAIVPVEERARPEEERDGRVDGGTGRPIPDNPEPGVTEFYRPVPRDGKLQSAQHRGALIEIGKGRCRVRRKQYLSRLSPDAELAAFRGFGGWDEVRPGA